MADHAATYGTWDYTATLTLPQSAVTWIPGRGYAITLDDQLKSDANTTIRWATDANAACMCPNRGDGGTGPLVDGYDWLNGNVAALRDWREHASGSSPIDYFCEQGHDSPLAQFSQRWIFNRTMDEVGLSVVTVQYNGKDYPAQLVPADCLAGCGVYAEVPCVHELQATVIKLRAPQDEHPVMCIWMRNGKGGLMERCGQ